MVLTGFSTSANSAARSRVLAARAAKAITASDRCIQFESALASRNPIGQAKAVIQV
jgi:hypothetical protein